MRAFTGTLCALLLNLAQAFLPPLVSLLLFNYIWLALLSISHALRYFYKKSKSFCVGVNVLMTCTWHLAGHVGRYGNLGVANS